MCGLHPTVIRWTCAKSKPQAGAFIDVVFVHGLTGDRFSTWQADGAASFWPGWLAKEFSNINFYTAGYDSGLFAKVFVGGGPTIIDRATMLLDGLISSPGRHPSRHLDCSQPRRPDRQTYAPAVS